MPPASGAGNAAPQPSTAAQPGGLPPASSAAPAVPGAAPGVSPAASDPPASRPAMSGPTGPPDPVLAAERDHLRRSREFLRLMREDVLGLEAMAGDRVSEEYLKADLYHRAEALRDLPDIPLFFGRLDYADDVVMNEGAAAAGDGGSGEATPPGQALPGERLHIGRRHIYDPDGHPVVIDWRAPVSR